MAITKVSRGLLNTGVSDSSDATAITIDSSERVGLNGLTPSDYYNTADDLVLGGSSSHGMTIVSGTTENGAIFFADGTSGNAEYEGYLIYEHGTNVMRFATSATERMRIDSSGNVGIGTTNGDVANDGVAARTYVGIIGSSNRGVLNIGSTAANGADGGKISFVNGANAIADIYSDADSGSQTNGFLQFVTGQTARMRITSSGMVGIGTTSPGYIFHVNDSASGGTSFQFQGNGPNLYTAMTNTSATNYIGVNGTQWEFYCGGTLKFQINTTNGGQTVSDQKFKKDIEDISYGLDTVKALQPRKFKWKENDESTIGFIAQEVKPVISEIITEPLQSPEGLENGMTLNYSALTAVLTKAIQEQQEIIDDLKARIEVLEA